MLVRNPGRTGAGTWSGGVGGGVAEALEEFGTQGVRVREAEFAGDGQGLGPGGAGGVGAGGRVMDVAEADGARGLAVPVAGSVEQVEGLCVAVDGLLVPPRW